MEALDFIFCRGRYAERQFSAPKLVLLDLKLPKINGVEVLRALREDLRTQFIPVVIMSSSKQEKDMIESYQLRVNSYVQKPVDFDQFQQVVQQLGMYWLVVNQAPPVETHTRELAKAEV